QDRGDVEQQVVDGDGLCEPADRHGGHDHDQHEQADDRELAVDEDAPPQRLVVVPDHPDPGGGGRGHDSSLASMSCRLCRTASSRSSTIAPMMSTPTTARCQKSGMPRMGRARLMVISSIAPMAAPHTEPTPPVIAMPPMTAAPTASSSQPEPTCELTDPYRVT